MDFNKDINETHKSMLPGTGNMEGKPRLIKINE